MKMQHKEALKILGLGCNASFIDIKAAYRKASMTYHPDRNPAGLEMMKLINSAYQALSDFVPNKDFENEDDGLNLGEELNAALNAVVGLGLTIEICGSWIWVSGDTKPYRDVLKGAGYRWAPKKLMWSFCGGERTSSRGKFSMDEIRSKHGSQTVNNKHYARLGG